jgi:hypothetical protein
VNVKGASIRLTIQCFSLDDGTNGLYAIHVLTAIAAMISSTSGNCNRMQCFEVRRE